MTKKEVYKKIKQWEIDHGESIVDEFQQGPSEIMYLGFLLGKGYSDFANPFIDELDSPTNRVCINRVVEVFNDDTEIDPKAWHRNYKRSMMLYAEFISCSTLYTERFKQFLKNTDYAEE